MVRESAKNRNEDEMGLVVLAHSDYLIDVAERRSRGETRVLEKRHLASLKKGGVSVICDHVGGDTRMFSTFPLEKIGTSCTPLERALYGVDCMLQEAQESSDEVLIVRDFMDIQQVRESHRLGIVLSLQGGSPIGQDLSLLRTFYRLGIRCLHLTANLRNQISDSCIGRTNGGLTEFGVEVVREMNRLGMVIDIAQLSPAGCMDVFDSSEQPVIASNSNAKALCDHPRNLDDKTIQRLAEGGGVMGIHCLPAFLSKKPGATIGNMVEHIKHVTNLVGVDHVAIGPDLLEDWPRDKYDCIWGSGQSLGSARIEFDYPEGFEDISKIPDLAALLSRSGYTDKEVDKILGGNLLRVFKQVWKH